LSDAGDQRQLKGGSSLPRPTVRGVRRRPVRDRVEEVFARLAGNGGESRAFCAFYPEMARRAADAADERRARGGALGPLDGLILSIKDLFDVAGSTTTAGSCLLVGRPAAQDHAEAVTRLIAAGCVPIGRTTMSELAFSGVGINPHFGTPGNSLDRQRIPGGSSSGAAVSVADRIADIGLGSDTGGSLRIPAALCGVTGFKPTQSRVSRRGVFPLSPTLDVVGPIAPTVAGCADAFTALTGTAPAAERSVSGMRIGVICSPRLYDHSDPRVIDAFEAALRMLERNGATLHNIDLAVQLDGIAAMQTVGTLPSIELAATLAMVGRDDDALIDPNVLARVSPGRLVSAVDYLRLRAMRNELRAGAGEIFTDVDVLAVPTVPLLPPLTADLADPEVFARINMLLLRNTGVFNILDLPAISIPMRAGQMSAGLMLVGPPFGDGELLASARSAESQIIRLN